MNKFDHKTGQHFEADGAKIYYEIVGNLEAPVLLILHGGLGNIEDLNSIVTKFASDFKIIGIDSRGQGGSTLGESVLSYERIQQDILAILGHLNINKLNVFGFSDGGIVAYRLAALRLLNINKLVTLGADWKIKSSDAVLEVYKKITAKSWREKFPETYDSYQKLNPEPDFDKLVPAIVKMWLDNSTTGYPGDTMKNIACPLLIIRGDEDHLVSLKSLVELRGLLDNSSFLNIPSASHEAFSEQQVIVLNAMKNFLLK